MCDHLNAYGADRTPDELDEASELQARLSIGFDGRRSGELVPLIMADIADEVSEESSDFKIITMQNAVITPEKLVVKKIVTVEGDDLAIEPISATTQLKQCLAAWRREGMFEQ